MGHKRKYTIYGYIYILPSFLLLIVFSILPIFMTGYFSFTKYNVIQPPVLVGLKNYIRMLDDPFISAAIKNTLIYTAIVVPAQTILSMVIASIIAAKFRNIVGSAFRSILFIPVIASMILCGTVWTFLLAPDETGVVNAVIGLFGVSAVNWLGKTSTALFSVCIVSIWKLVGYYLVIYFAGIMDIPRSIYEAAKVDGGSQIQQFWYITLPSLKPITFLVVTLGTIWSFQVFDLVYTMTSGGPGKSTVTLVLTIYTTAFREYSMGYASSIAILLLVIILFISSIQKFLFSDRQAGK